MSTLTAVNKKRMSKMAREINAIITIAARDVTLAIKTPAMLIFNLAMPMFFIGIMGGSLSQNLAGGMGFSYNQFVMVGIVVNTLFMMTITGITSLVQDRDIGFTQGILVSPISRYSIILGKIFGSSFSAIIQLLGTFIIAFIMGIPLTFSQVLLLLILSPFICLVASSIGIMVVGLVHDQRLANIVAMVLTMPQMFLSGVLIPINNSSGILKILGELMPMTYCLDLVRDIFYSGTPEYDAIVMHKPLFNLTIILCFTILSLVIGTYAFVRSETNK